MAKPGYREKRQSFNPVLLALADKIKNTASAAGIDAARRELDELEAAARRTGQGYTELGKKIAAGLCYCCDCRGRFHQERAVDRKGRMKEPARGGDTLGARMGEILEATPTRPVTESSSRRTFGGRERSLPLDIDKKASHYAQQLAKHPEAIKEGIKKAKDLGEIPTRRNVLRSSGSSLFERLPPAEFVRWWDETVRGKGKRSNNPDPGYFVEQAESLTEITQQQVSKWRGYSCRSRGPQRQRQAPCIRLRAVLCFYYGA